MFDFVLKIFLFLSPIFLIPHNGLAERFQFFQFGYFSSSISLVQLQFFQYGTIILFMTALFTKPQRLFQDKWFGVLLSICILSVYFHPKTIVNFSNVFLGFLLYYLVVSYMKNSKSIFWVIAAVAAMNTAWAILQFFNIHLIYRPTNEIIGLMSYKSQLGIYQALAVPLCYVLNPWLSIIPLTGLLLSKSATSIIPMFIGMCYLLRNKIFSFKSMPILLFLISCLAIFGGRMFYKLSLRFDVWVETLKMISQKLIYGHGVGVFQYIDKKTEYTDPYSTYLEVAYVLGLFGLIALLFFLKDKFSFKSDSFTIDGLYASCLILVIAGLGYSFMDYPRLAGTAIVLFGLLTIKNGGVT